MHVTHVITTLNVGGAESRLLDMCRRMPGRGIRTSVVYLKGDGALVEGFRDAGMEVVKVPVRWVLDPLALLPLKRELKRLAPDIVHTHMFKADLHGYVAARWAGVPRIIGTKHAAEEERRLGPVAAADRWIARGSDVIVSISEDLARFTAEVEGIPREKIRVIYNRIDVGRMTARRSRADVRAELGIPEGEPVVMITARLVPYKGHRVLLAAMRRVRMRFPSAKLVIIGDGEDGPELRRMAQPDQDAVLFLGTRLDIPDLLAACDCYAQPSLREGLGLSLAEAMAMQRPCVASSAGALPEILTHEVDGLIVPPGDPDATADAIVRLLEDPDLAHRLAKAARRTVEERFDVSRTVDEYVALYQEIAGKDV